jgi:hypothetical protein
LPTISTADASRILTAPHNSHRSQADIILYDGSGLNVDCGSYLGQHDVVYLAPALVGAQGMTLGDGDLAAMLWCPERLQFQLQKSDLWADPSDSGALPADWRQVSAGAISLISDPSFLQDPGHYEQRLCLHSGVVTIQSDNVHGACQITTFVSATAGVLVVRYRDQSVRGAHRRVDLTIERDAHLFALGETIGVLQAFEDRRYALLARVTGAEARAKNESANHCSLNVEQTRATEFTLYVAVATSPRNGDPVAMARSRIEAAAAKGFDRLLTEQRQHWSEFWGKSFVRLHSSDSDPLPGYLENLWYLGLYHQACGSRGFDAPLANGGLWLGGEDNQPGPAIYAGADLRAQLGGLITANHLELSVPYVDTYFRMLPALAARTGSDLGMSGARFPSHFNRFGDDLTIATAKAIPSVATKRLLDPSQLLGEGLETGLLVWEAWRRAPDTFFLRERAYPLLRASMEFAIERCHSRPELWNNPKVRTRIGSALRALLWADEEYEFADEMRPEWERVWRLLSILPPRYSAPELQPFGVTASEDAAGVFRAVLTSMPQQPCGLFVDDSGVPDISVSARLCAGLSTMLVTESPIPDDWAPGKMIAGMPQVGFGGAAPSAIEVFAGLPGTWSGAFSLVAPGGFRVSAEAVDGRTRYVAVKSLLGGLCRLVNPWGESERARIVQGRTPLFETAGPILEFMTESNTDYLIEHYDLPVSRAVRVRLGGRPNVSPKVCGMNRLGIQAATLPMSQSALHRRLPGLDPASAVVTSISRIDRARMLRRR